MKQIYKGYEISTKPNEWGYFEAISTKDCDAPTITAKTIRQLKVEIDDLDF